MSDIWELQFGAAGLLPGDDADKDGQTNLQESFAGTNPFDPNSKAVITDLQRSGNAVTLSWPSITDKGYQVYYTTSLTAPNWQPLSAVLNGTGTTMSGTYMLTDSAVFFRLQVSDLDSDGDGVSDWEEMMLGLNPYYALSDGFTSDLVVVKNALQATANTITVTATDSQASDDGLDPGVFTIKRAGRLEPVTIAYTMSGTAVAGTDYIAPSGTVTFGLGVRSMTVSVKTLPASPNVLNGLIITLNITSNANYTVGSPANATVTVNAKPLTNSVVQEVWKGLDTFISVSYLPTASPPTTTRTLTTLESPYAQQLGDYTGTRVRGYLIPPTTGLYTFWLASNDNGQLWISTDDQPVNLIARAYVSTNTTSRQWTKEVNQKSLPMQLTAGQRYYFEALQKNATGSDNMAVGWAKPGEATIAPSEVVPGSALAPYLALTPPGPTILYYAGLTPESGAANAGSGSASVRLSADESYALVTLNTNTLSSSLTGAAVRGPANSTSTGPVIFDLSAATPRLDGTYVWPISDASQVAALKAGLVYLEVSTVQNPLGELRGQFSRSLGSAAFTPPAAPPAWSDDHADANAAGRFLAQTSFGATNATIAQVQSLGYEAFLNQQFAQTMSLHMPITDAAIAALPANTAVSSNQAWEAWWKNAIAAPDQLRQRVAFALSELMVISDYANGLRNNAIALSTYNDVLVRNAFGNFRQLIEDVTLSPSMGMYLNMMANDRSDPAVGTHPNENYARECMQLFTIGLSRLNPDGSLALDSSNNPVPTYGQTEVTGIARVFTGWNWGQANTAVWNYTAPNYRVPMAAVPSHHDGAAKAILGGVVLPAGQSQAQDLKDALDVIFYHPNVGPFIARQLIQRLVTSNPSPGYIYRVAQAFADNGKGVRGDMQAVLKAILLDYEARSSLAAAAPGYGKQREPAIRLAAFYRIFNATSQGGAYKVYSLDTTMGQTPMHSPSVFNFFSPNYAPPGPVATSGLVAPEFQITTDTSAITSSNKMRDASFLIQGTSTDTARIIPDYTPQIALAGSPAALVDSLNTLLMSGQMSADMRTAVINGVTALSKTTTALEKVQTAVYLIVTSPQYVIQK